MLKINKNNEPDFWHKVKKHHPGIVYKDLNESDKCYKGLRDQLRVKLIEEQKGICAYCCVRINENNAHNEHIKPEDKYPNLSMDYDNIVASCNAEEDAHCGGAKENKYDKRLFVSPLDQNIDFDKQFAYAPDGEVIGLTTEAKYTIELLKLNEHKLKQARKATYLNCKGYNDPELVRENMVQDSCGQYYSYADMVLYGLNHEYFEPEF